MRLQLHHLVLVRLALSQPLQAQISADTLTRRHLAGGISLALPASWKPLSDSLQANISRTLDTVFEHSRDSLIRTSLKRGRPITLLHERARGVLDPSASFNVTPSPGTTPTTFSSLTAAQVATGLAFLCGTMREGLGRMGARVVSCDPAVTDHGAGRTIAITQLVRSGAAGFVTVWLVQFPDKDVLYTLTLSAPQAEQSRYEQLFRTIWRSVEIPAP